MVHIFSEQDQDGGKRSDDSDLDGAPLDSSERRYGGKSSNTNPKQSRAGGMTTTTGSSLPAGFVPSKWETIDQKTVESQAVTSKWDIFDQIEDTSNKHMGK